MAKINKKRINLATQSLNLKQFSFVSSKIDNGLLAYVKVKPTPYSDEYELLIRYDSLETIPHVLLINPYISELTKLPHVYSNELYEGKSYPRLCLYLPGGWNNTMLIAKTILPWAIEWLYYYEIWLITGKWLGGGLPYAVSKDPSK
jgi:hypothetical protein